jgi:hypothetical protein
MDCACNELLAGSRLARDENARVGCSNAIYQALHFFHLSAVADHVAGEAELFPELARNPPRLPKLES